jgi:hypothetical protein
MARLIGLIGRRGAYGINKTDEPNPADQIDATDNSNATAEG